jgi:serine protease Do/serine protease DegQ
LDYRFLLGALSGALLCFYTACAGAALPAALGGQASLAPMLEQVTPAVVNISTRTIVRTRESPLLSDPFFRYFFDVPERPRERKSQSLGSGVVIDMDKGYVVTNHHVIDKADEISVTLRDGRVLNAELVGADSETDIALLKVTADKLSAVRLGDSDKLRVGDFVVAIGNPFGLGQTVTSGIVSALGRSGLGIEGYEDFIQTDASINPGNSGGALVDLEGNLIGINTAILAPSGGNVGIGFAIPVNMMQQVIEHLSRYGEVQRGLLGARVQDLTPDLAAAFGLDTQQGAAVVQVDPASAAEQAGLQPGDIITAINGQAVQNAAAVRNRVGLIRVGETVNLSVIRKGKALQLQAVVSGQANAEGADLSPYLAGAAFLETEVETNRGPLKRVQVKEVAQGSPAWNTGLRKGDVILSINRVRVQSVAELAELMSQRNRNLLLKILREDLIISLLLQ